MRALRVAVVAAVAVVLAGIWAAFLQLLAWAWSAGAILFGGHL